MNNVSAWCGVSLDSHLRSVAVASSILFKKYWVWRARSTGLHEELLEIAGLLHDIGKAARGYQDNINAGSGKCRANFLGHEILGAIALAGAFISSNRVINDNIILLTIVILQHHHGMRNRFQGSKSPWIDVFTNRNIRYMIADKLGCPRGRELGCIIEAIHDIEEYYEDVIYPVIVELYPKAVSIMPRRLGRYNNPQQYKARMEEIMRIASRSITISMAGTASVLTGYTAVSDSMVAGLERNEFRVEALKRSYVYRVVGELGEPERILEIVTDNIRRLY